jgi:hypothetical protein
LKYYKYDGKTQIDTTKPKEISLENALKEIGNFPTVRDNYIGFVNEEDGTIQFIKENDDSWLIDVPIKENDEYVYSLQDSDLTTEEVQTIVKKFFSGDDYQSLCNLSKS